MKNNHTFPAKPVKKLGIVLMSAIMLFSVSACSTNSKGNASKTSSPSTSQKKITTKSTSYHQPDTDALIAIVDKDPELKKMLTDAIAEGKKINPNKDKNPAQTLDEFYSFIDWASLALPWNINYNDDKQPSLFRSIDQSLNYFYFLADIKLPQLEDKGYYRPCLEYYPPYSDWMVKFTKNWGAYLSQPASWNDQYLQRAKNDENFGLQNDWYEDPSNWHSFNDFFARKLKDPSVRPIASPDDDSILTAPADSEAQGLWDIDKNSEILNSSDQVESENGDKMVVKSKGYNSIPQILHGSKYANDFANGSVTHTFLNVQDYHRYHFPISGKILEKKTVMAQDAIGGLTYWDSKIQRYMLSSTNPNWESIESRQYVIIDNPTYGKVALVPVGMSQISSVNFEDNVKVGAEVKKGDPLGYFLFGGSDYMMIFQKGVKLDITIPKTDGEYYDHVLMGEQYGKLSKE
jgi:phosphatidylserine decarboxylase